MFPPGVDGKHQASVFFNHSELAYGFQELNHAFETNYPQYSDAGKEGHIQYLMNQFNLSRPEALDKWTDNRRDLYSSMQRDFSDYNDDMKGLFQSVVSHIHSMHTDSGMDIDGVYAYLDTPLYRLKNKYRKAGKLHLFTNDNPFPTAKRMISAAHIIYGTMQQWVQDGLDIAQENQKAASEARYAEAKAKERLLGEHSVQQETLRMNVRHHIAMQAKTDPRIRMLATLKPVEEVANSVTEKIVAGVNSEATIQQSIERVVNGEVVQQSNITSKRSADDFEYLVHSNQGSLVINVINKKEGTETSIALNEEDVIQLTFGGSLNHLFEKIGPLPTLEELAIHNTELLPEGFRFIAEHPEVLTKANEINRFTKNHVTSVRSKLTAQTSGMYTVRFYSPQDFNEGAFVRLNKQRLSIKTSRGTEVLGNRSVRYSRRSNLSICSWLT